MPQIFLIVYAAIIGLCFGSFANVVVCRLPIKKSIVMPPSHCPACEKRLGLLDLLPVVSWLLLRGRCRYCKAKISARYPAVEAVCALLFACMAIYAPAWQNLIPLCLLAFTLLCLTPIDWDIQEIPDELLVFGAVVGISWVIAGFFFRDYGVYAPVWHDALLGVLAGALPLFLIDLLVLLLLKKDGFGFGDVKMMAMVGMFLGWRMTFMALFFAFIIGGCYALCLMVARRVKRGEYLPFGPFLAVGTLAALWFGPGVFAFYFGMY
jgi:leader peptidase (prepilin peptidase)/N-methyltransferase